MRRRQPRSRAIDRRQVLKGLGAAGVVAALGPRPAAAQAPGRQETVEAALRRLFGGRPMQDGEGTITLEVPPIAENGGAVPVAVQVESPMTPGSHVRHIWLVAERNRIPVVARATLTPDSGQAYMAATIRLGETGAVRAVVERSDGTLLTIRRDVRVTVSGCGV